jgi:FtsZ-binding cell division protein ZapB
MTNKNIGEETPDTATPGIDYTEELGKLSEIVSGLALSVKKLEEFHSSDSAEVATVVSQVEALEKTLEEMKKTQEQHTERLQLDNKWKNRRVVGLLDRVTIVIGAIIALIATYFAGKGMMK